MNRLEWPSRVNPPEHKYSSAVPWIILAVVLAIVVGTFLHYVGLLNEDINAIAGRNQILNDVHTNMVSNENLIAQGTKLQRVKTLLTDSETDTTGWKTYDSTELGFTVKYPQYYFIRQELLTGSSRGIQVVDKKYHNMEVPSPDVFVSIQALEEGQLPSDWINQRMELSDYSSEIFDLILANGSGAKLYASSSISATVVLNSGSQIALFSFGHFFDDEAKWEVGNGMLNNFSFVN